MGYDLNQYKNGVRGQLISCECDFCSKSFTLTRRLLSTKINDNQVNVYCSRNCSVDAQKKQVKIQCLTCKRSFSKLISSLSPTVGDFCCQGCYFDFKRNNRSVSKQDLEKAALGSETWQEVYEKLNFGSKPWERRFLKTLSVETSHLLEMGRHKKRQKGHREIHRNSQPIEKYLNNEIKIQSVKLKQRLFKEGLKEEKCESCKNSEWLGQKIPTELHHKDGDHYNNNLDNLEILCPTCHALTSNYAGKNSKKPKAEFVSDQILLEQVPNFYNKRQILKHFGYVASGKGYARLTNLLKNNPNIQFKKADPEGIEPSI